MTWLISVSEYPLPAEVNRENKAPESFPYDKGIKNNVFQETFIYIHGIS